MTPSRSRLRTAGRPHAVNALSAAQPSLGLARQLNCDPYSLGSLRVAEIFQGGVGATQAKGVSRPVRIPVLEHSSAAASEVRTHQRLCSLSVPPGATFEVILDGSGQLGPFLLKDAISAGPASLLYFATTIDPTPVSRLTDPHALPTRPTTGVEAHPVPVG